MEDCIFCKIINREIPSEKVYEDENVYAFKDIQPQASIHVLVIPKKHISSVNDLNEENIDAVKNIFLAINKIAKELNIAEKGYRVITNTGEGAGQTVKHLHYHLLAGDNLSEKIV